MCLFKWSVTSFDLFHFLVAGAFTWLLTDGLAFAFRPACTYIFTNTLESLGLPLNKDLALLYLCNFGLHQRLAAGAISRCL
jgi:hypothetical protein